jgi:hypothetical protein
MSYVNAGYAVALSTLFLYAVTLVVRRRRRERAFEMSQPPEPPQPPGLSDPSGRPAPGRSDVVTATGERS